MTEMLSTLSGGKLLVILEGGLVISVMVFSSVLVAVGYWLGGLLNFFFIICLQI